MTIENPEVDTTNFQDAIDLQRKISGALEIGVVCHCTEFEELQGLASKFAHLIKYTDEANETRTIGYIDLVITPSDNSVAMRRICRRVSNRKLPDVKFLTSDSDATVRLKLFDAIDGIRRLNGIIASEADSQALKDAIEANYE